MNIFIVTPAYNEGKEIEEVIERLKSTKMPIILVDDGSRDKTSRLKSFGEITVLRHKVNLGKGAALKTGSDAAFHLGADAVITMDADGQHDISDLPKFIKALMEGYQVVFGSRNLSHGVPLVRYLGNKLASILITFLFGIYVSDILSGYRAFTKKAYKKIAWDSSGYGVETEIIIRTSKARLKHCEVPIKTLYLDAVKGVTMLDAINIFFDVVRWKMLL